MPAPRHTFLPLSPVSTEAIVSCVQQLCFCAILLGLAPCLEYIGAAGSVAQLGLLLGQTLRSRNEDGISDWVAATQVGNGDGEPGCQLPPGPALVAGGLW